MTCDNCGKTLLKNENVCPYCGRVYGPSQAVQFFIVLLIIVAGVLGWLYFSA